MRRLTRILAALCLVALTACGAGVSVSSSDEAVANARYVADGPPTITLFTVINNKSGSGAHTALMISGEERILFDPAGSWYHPKVPERNDVHFGITPKVVLFYIDYHSRKTYDVIEQSVVVTPAVARMVADRAKAHGAVARAHCTESTSAILSVVPGFESLPQTWFPKQFSKAFGQLPGVKTTYHTDDDDDKNHGVLLVQANGDPFVE